MLVGRQLPLEEAAPADWRYARAQGEAARNGSITQCIFGLYGRPCPLSAELIEAIDAMLGGQPERRPTAPQAQQLAWVRGTPPHGRSNDARVRSRARASLRG